MRNIKRIGRARLLLLLLAAAFFLVLGAREVYERFYGHRTLVLGDTVPYRKQVAFEGVVLYDQQLYGGTDVEIDPAADGRRMAARQEIGKLTDSPHTRESRREDTARLWESLRNRDFDTLTALASFLPPEPPEENPDTPEEDKEPIYTEYVPAAPFQIRNGRIVLGRAAFVSGQTDGYEEILPYDAVQQIGASDVSALLQQSVARRNDRGFSLINNHRFAVALLLDASIPMADDYLLEIDAVRLEGKTLVRSQSKTGSFLILTMEEGFDVVFPQRFIQGQILTQDYDALRIPESALTEKHGTRGVFLKNDDAIVEFVPINEGEMEEGFLYVPVEAGSLRVYDEIYLHPSGVKEGEFIE